jgi:hypothetical protein
VNYGLENMWNRASYSVFSRKWVEENHLRLDLDSRSANRDKNSGLSKCEVAVLIIIPRHLVRYLYEE